MTDRQAEPSRRVDLPEAGHFLFDTMPARVLVPARISLVHGQWSCEIDGASTGPSNADPVHVSRLFEVWHWGVRVDAATYVEAMMKRSSRLFCFPQVGRPSNWYA
jgi:hypothetical protein